MLVFVLMFAVMSSAWNLVGGFAGYPSLGHAAFFGIGAYALAIIFKGRQLTSGYEPFLWLPVIGLVGALIGWPIAAVVDAHPRRRVRDRHDHVPVRRADPGVQPARHHRRLAGHGAAGTAVSGRDASSGRSTTCSWRCSRWRWDLTFAAMRSKVGLALVAVRADEDKARGIGVPITGVKVLAFSVSVGLTAMVGGVWAYYESFIYPQFAVDPLITIAIVLMTFLGGRATLWGPVLGAFILETGQQYLAYELGGEPALPDRVRAGVPAHHAVAAARDPADRRGPAAPAAARWRAATRRHAAASQPARGRWQRSHVRAGAGPA